MNGQVRKKRKQQKVRLSHSSQDDPQLTVKFLQGDSSSSDFETPVKPYSASKKSAEKCLAREKQLCIIVIICVLIIITFSVLLVVLHYQVEDTKTQLTCSTPACVETAGSMLAQMNLSVDPCEDFYEFSCGLKLLKSPAPPDKAKWSVFAEISQQNDAQLKRLLDEPSSEYQGKQSAAIQKVKMYYRACMNTEAIENTGSGPVKKMIKDLGSWPLTSDSASGSWVESQWDMESSLALSHISGGSALFSMSIGVDDKNSSRNILKFDQSGLTLGSYESYTGNDSKKFHDAFVEFFSDITELLGAEGNMTRAAQDIWDFELKLAQAHDKPEDRVDNMKLYHIMMLAELQANILNNKIDVMKYMDGIFMGVTEKPESNKEPVLVYAPDYLEKMVKIMEQTPHSVLATYIVWHMVQTVVNYLPLPYRMAYQDLKKVTVGVTSEPPHWLQCVRRANSVAGFATGALFVQHHFSLQDRHTVEMLLSTIRESFKMRLMLADWMDEETRDVALDKLEAVGQKIGYPDFITDVGKLDDRYEKLKVVEDQPFQNMLNARQYEVDRVLNKLRQAPDKNEWHMIPTEVNAYYSESVNAIHFPAGILQKPFYNPDAPMVVNFGSTGSIMGHELTHGFDNSGGQYDKNGNLRAWWTDSSMKNFHQRADCLVDQYNQFKVLTSHLNGNTTLAENIADNGGMRTAYEAWRQWQTEQEAELPPLPGLNMTDQQLFFLGFSQVWCTHYTDEYALRSLITDVHSFAKYRVIGTLSNMPEFAQAYNCPVGSRMNPQEKCAVW